MNRWSAVVRVVILAGILFVLHASASARAGELAPTDQAHFDFLRAIDLADEGSRPEALQLLAESLRLQPKGNPAAALAFQLLTELRANSSLQLIGHAGGVLCAAYSPDGTKIITGSDDHTARLWDAVTGKPLLPPFQQGDDVLTVAFSPDGERVVTGAGDGVAQVWDVKTGKPVGAAMKESDEIMYARFSPDGKIVATGSGNNNARLWDAVTGRPLIPEIIFHETVFQVNFNPAGDRFVIANDKSEICDVKTGKPVLPPFPYGNRVFSACFSPDGSRIVIASADRTARVYDAVTGKPVGAIMNHGHWVDAAAFNSNGSRVVTASWDHTARVWDAATGLPVTPPLRHGDAVVGAVFSPDGARVVTASNDHTARIWDAVTGDPLTMPLQNPDQVTTVLFSPAGSSVLVASRDHTVRFWDVPPQEEAPAWLADLADFGSTQVRYDVSRTPDLPRMQVLRLRLLASTSNDPWEKFGRWYFAEGAVRPISPWSTVSLKDYVDGLIARGDKQSIEAAIVLSHDQPSWMVKLVPMKAKFDSSPPTTPKGD